MATRSGAEAVGLSDVGSLEPGYKADLLRIETNHPAFVPVTELDELLAHVAWSGSSKNVTDVWVNGNQVVADGSLHSFDLDEAIAEVAQDGREVTKKTFIASFKADLSIEEIEIIFNRLSESTDILNFRILRSNAQSIDLEYESYLGPEDAASFLSSMGALTNL